MGLESSPSNLDPRFATDAISTRINRLLYRRLVDFDANSRPVADLANWEMLAPTHYRFRLGADGRVFHHGERLRAADVRATYESILEPGSGSPHRASLGLIRKVVALDDNHVDFYLHKADALFPALLTVGVLPESLISAGHPFSSRPVGSGEFRAYAWPAEGQLQLQRRTDGQMIEFLTVKDPGVRVMKLQKGEIDLLQNDLPPELLDYAMSSGRIRKLQRTGSNFSYMGFNLADPKISDIRVRQAIAHAIDRRSIIRFVLGEAARPAEGLLPPLHWAGVPDVQDYAYDPDRARQLLADAGYHSKHRLELTYKTSSNPFRIRIASIIQQQLSEVGIRVSLQSYDWGTFFGDIKSGNFQMYTLAWVGMKSPDVFRYIFHSESLPPAGANRGRLRDPEVDRLIEVGEARTELGGKEEIYHRLQKKLHEILIYVPLWYEDHVALVRSEIQDYDLHSDGNYDALLRIRRQ